MKRVIAIAFLVTMAAGAANAAEGGEVCRAESAGGTHAATVVWSERETSRARAEQSAMSKCLSEAAAKENCQIVQCW